MISLLLPVIYIAFISLGLPDAMLGSAWPIVHETMAVPVSYAGIISFLIAGGTILSSLSSDRLIRRFGAGAITAVSVALTAGALFGFSAATAFWQLCLIAIPYGLGAGSVDSAINNYVALHYKSRHMSWLHCFWGIGASLGPYIMGLSLAGGSWRGGYRTVGIIQVALCAVLFISLPLWQKSGAGSGREHGRGLSLSAAAKLPGAGSAFAAFFCYCALEATAGLWASSYLVFNKNVDKGRAAQMAALFYLGITVGRFISGFVSGRLGDRRMVRLGQIIILAGVAALLLPMGEAASCAGLVLMGLGCAPVFPSLLHATPQNFGAENSQSVMGIQMASAYVGATLVPPLFGFASSAFGEGIYPYCLALLAAAMLFFAERLGKTEK